MWPYLTGETGLLPRGNAWPRSVQAAAGKEGLEVAGYKREDLGESSYVPAGCSYSSRSGEALFNANAAGGTILHSAGHYRAACHASTKDVLDV